MQRMRIESIAVGDEILTGSTVDTNLSVLARGLEMVGHVLSSHSIIGDSLKTISDALTRAVTRSDVVIVSGGLGPTRDDITREAAAAAFTQPLRLNVRALGHIRKRFERTKREMSPTNTRQAMFPARSVPLKNEAGTAWGFLIRHGRTRVYFLPGVPREFLWMLGRHVFPSLTRGRPIAVRWLHIFGLPESGIEQLLSDTDTSGMTLGFYPHFPEVHLKLTARGTDASRRLLKAEKSIRERLGIHIFGTGEQTMEGVVGRLLLKKGATLAVAESCTGGLVSHRLTNIPGSSGYMERGVVCYSDRSKTEILGVRKAVVKRYGAVSREAAMEMARGARKRARTTYGISITGIAGPRGGSRKKPVGTIFVALSGHDGDQVRSLTFPGTREQIKLIASEAALDLVRRTLLGISR